PARRRSRRRRIASEDGSRAASIATQLQARVISPAEPVLSDAAAACGAALFRGAADAEHVDALGLGLARDQDAVAAVEARRGVDDLRPPFVLHLHAHPQPRTRSALVFVEQRDLAAVRQRGGRGFLHLDGERLLAELLVARPLETGELRLP